MPTQVKFHQGILNFTLQSPDVQNAFSVEDARVFKDQIRKYSPCAVVLCPSPGRVFCSGGNLKFYSELQKSRRLKRHGSKVNHEIAATLDFIYNLPVPTLACVSGDCIGGGIELISCFDHVVSL